MKEPRRTEKHELARNGVPAELQGVFDEFVDHYKFAATKHHGSPFVSYVVLAEMVKLGWRCVGASSESETVTRRSAIAGRQGEGPRGTSEEPNRSAE